MTKFSAPQQNQLAQIGAFLRDHREKQSKSLEDIAIRTYIRPQLLNGIETGDPELLPEPIFVQGFIRRYGEALGLNGIELSQQFTVTSIPSTPRPPRQAPPTDSVTTRLTRASAASATARSTVDTQSPPAAATPSSPMFSAGSAGFVAGAGAIASSQSFDNVVNDIDNDINNDIPNNLSTPDCRGDTTTDVTTTVSSIDGLPEPSPFVEDRATAADVEEDFASKIAAFDKANLNSSGLNSSGLSSGLNLSETNTLDTIPTNFAATSPAAAAETTLDSTLDSWSAESRPFAGDLSSEASSGLSSETVSSEIDSSSAEIPVLNNQASLQDLIDNQSFDDELPAAFTTQSDGFQSSAAASSTELASPVGVEYDNYDQPNLKPFIIGGVVAAIATGAIILTSILGGFNRQPSVADSTDNTEQVAEGSADALPPVPEAVAPVEAAKPPVSTAPVYVEAKATSEVWVSIIADDNPTPVFEGLLQAGESKVWEAQKNISVYSGDAGELQVGANGGKSEVMGAAGQLAEKTFPPQ